MQEHDQRLQEIIDDPENFVAVLWPSASAIEPRELQTQMEEAEKHHHQPPSSKRLVVWIAAALMMPYILLSSPKPLMHMHGSNSRLYQAISTGCLNVLRRNALINVFPGASIIILLPN